ncbi:class I SAM-dependent methyltransferase [Streptomyces sp. NA02950]|uniref:SAM-dependent methyltransferase n=1 Tax=Streptomyces sp. NA02950 TaxID=2742137 RepID=UPI001591A6CD|nr:cyclopropane-fatty-acyl-phospholipid synthase family protein [Streptomyces sp. NA02950]QKV91821.1 class I SAM-dependent methyltransferase [Streptomyces sp. NA02950]
MSDVAAALVPFAERLLGAPLPVRLCAWDGSEAGPPGAPRVRLRSRRALRGLVWRPTGYGLAEAYISGDLDVEGDVTEGLRAVWHAVRGRPAPPSGPALTTRARAAATAARLGALGPWPPARAAPGGPDATAEFHERLLDPSMAQSCAYWTSEDPAYRLADAQRDKLDVICRKLNLVPGARLLDIGCGWGALALHAADRYGAQVTAVTTVREEHDLLAERVRELGLDHRIDVDLCDYRALRGGQYEAVACVETGEYVGDEQYPDLVRTLHRMLRPGGRALVQQISRPSPGADAGPPLAAYLAPQLRMRPLGETIGRLEAAGLEVRASESLREHYVRTVTAWRTTLEADWDGFRRLVGEATARGRHLWLAGAALALEEGRMGIDQILAVRPTDRGVSCMPVTPESWYPAVPV